MLPRERTATSTALARRTAPVPASRTREPARRPLAFAAIPLFLVLVSDRVLSQALHHDMTSALKIAIFVGLAACMIVTGYRPHSGVMIVIVAWTVILVLSVGVADRYPGVTSSVLAHAWIGYLYPFAALAVRWERFDRERVALLLACLPMACVVLGLVFQVLGYQSVVEHAYTGVPRLQGSLIPAWLAGLSLVGTCAAIWLRPRRRYATAFAVIDMLITIATAARTETSVTVVVVMLMALRSHPTERKARRGRSAILVFGVLLMGAFFLPALIARSQKARSGAGGSSGGRTSAWSYYLQDVEHSILFGRGVGAGSVEVPPNATNVYTHLKAPHNSYIQLLLDTGIVGLCLLVYAYGVVYRRARPRQNSYDRALARYFGLAILFCAIFDNVLVAISFAVPVLVFLAVLHEPGPVPEKSATGPAARSTAVRASRTSQRLPLRT